MMSSPPHSRDVGHASALRRTQPLAAGQDHAQAWLSRLGGAAVGLAAATPGPVCRVLRHLPTQPPSLVLARVLDRVLLPRLRADWM
ncbi:hypothetical protein THIX_60171 [Thiomonas sp. X19]|nr:hypothetical protein THIX_60171 [Thiomonas sp. X19]